MTILLFRSPCLGYCTYFLNMFSIPQPKQTLAKILPVPAQRLNTSTKNWALKGTYPWPSSFWCPPSPTTSPLAMWVLGLRQLWDSVLRIYIWDTTIRMRLMPPKFPPHIHRIKNLKLRKSLGNNLIQFLAPTDQPSIFPSQFPQSVIHFSVMGLEIRDFNRASSTYSHWGTGPSHSKSSWELTQPSQGMHILLFLLFVHLLNTHLCWTLLWHARTQSKDIAVWCVMTLQSWYYPVSVTWSCRDSEDGTKHGQTHQRAKEGADWREPQMAIACESSVL